MRYVFAILFVFIFAFSMISKAETTEVSLAEPYTVQSASFVTVLKAHATANGSGMIPCSVSPTSCSMLMATARMTAGPRVKVQFVINGAVAPIQSASNADGSVTYTSIVPVPGGQEITVKFQAAKKAATDPDPIITALVLNIATN